MTTRICFISPTTLELCYLLGTRELHRTIQISRGEIYLIGESAEINDQTCVLEFVDLGGWAEVDYRNFFWDDTPIRTWIDMARMTSRN